MAPDFRYFFSLAPQGHFGHSLKGVFVFCLPVGLAVLWIFQTVMKRPLISLAPAPHQQRLVALAKPFRWGKAGRFTLILVSLLLGSISHLAWDAFTHSHGLVVRNFPDLRSPLEEFGSHRPLYNVLQHGSSLLGMALLVFWYWRWFRRTTPQPVPRSLQMSVRARRWIVGSMTTVSASVSFLYAYFASHRLASLGIFVATSVVTFLSVIFVATVGFSIWWHISSNRQKHSALSQHSVFF